MRLLRHPDAPWIMLVALAAVLYLYGLGSPYAPTNGDEMVYIHIARMTSESGHWLPLQSELVGTRNTKPPLLIWQAILASDWGRHWNLFALRLPSILYTFASTALVGFFAFRISNRLRSACLAASLYLLFFSTFRYGRVYLTSAPETFWLALPMWWLLWQRLRPGAGTASPHLDWLGYSALGLVMGLGAAYKSFALLAPCAAAYWCASLLGESRWHWPTVLRLSAGTAWSVLLGLGLFSLWFVLDPDPAAVWQEFVLAENAGKMQNSMGYWQAALHGPYPMWTQLLAYPVNAGLLALNAMGFCLWALRQGLRRGWLRQLSPAHGVLLTWLLVWLIIFTIPSQRSERYVIPAMPALAIAMALAWDRVSRLWSMASLLLAAPALVMLARIAWVIGGMDIGSALDTYAAVLVCAIGLLAVALGLRYAAWSRNASLLACAAVYACFALMVAPLSDPQSDYSEGVQQQLQGQRIAVPNGFTGQYENYHFVFPGPRVGIFPFDAEGRNTGERYPEMPAEARLLRLLDTFDAVVWLQDSPAQSEPSCVPQCQVLAQRWHVRSRHKSGEITLDNLWYPDQWLFSREWLIKKS